MSSTQNENHVSERRGLPSCRRCKHRKIKCIQAGAKCSACAQAGAACLIVDPVTGKEYTRGYVHELELREQELLRQTQNADALHTSPTAGGSDAATTGTRFVGESSSLR
jgi:hypothetical protein